MPLPDALETYLGSLTESELAELRAARGVSSGVQRQFLPSYLTAPHSLLPALQRLDVFSYQLLHAAMALPRGRRRADIDELVDGRASEEQVTAALAVLRRLALIWDFAPDRYAVNVGLLQVIAMPCGLGPPVAELLPRVTVAGLQGAASRFAVVPEARKDALVAQFTALLTDEDVVGKVVESLSPQARDLLELIAAEGGELALDASYYLPEDVRELLASLLIIGNGYTNAVVPREVALILRGGQVLRTVTPTPPEVGAPVSAEVVARRSAEAAAALTLDLQAVLTSVAATPLTQLASGGVGAKEVRRLAAAIKVDADRLQLLLGLAEEAGLIGLMGVNVGVLPASREFLDSEPTAQWQRLASTWLRSRDNYLGLPALPAPGRRRPREIPPSTYADMLRPGRQLDVDDVLALLSWHLPLADPTGDPAQLAAVLLAETDILGLAARGALSEAGRLLPADPAAAAACFAGAMPTRIGAVVLQGDLTATVTGPPTPALARLLDGAATGESRGAAATWRFTPASVRRHFDAGGSAEQLLAELAAASSGVPGVLRELVADAARRHGEVTVHAATTVLLARDAAIAATLLGDRRLAKLGLSALAPTVLVSGADQDTVLDGVRKAGFSPTLVRDGRAPTLSKETEKLVRASIDAPRQVVTRLLAAVREGQELTVTTYSSGSWTTERLGELRVDPPYLSGVSVSDGTPRRLRLRSILDIG